MIRKIAKSNKLLKMTGMNQSKFIQKVRKIYAVRQNTIQKNYSFGFEPTKMHCIFTYPTNAF